MSHLRQRWRALQRQGMNWYAERLIHQAFNQATHDAIVAGRGGTAFTFDEPVNADNKAAEMAGMDIAFGPVDLGGARVGVFWDPSLRPPGGADPVESAAFTREDDGDFWVVCVRQPLHYIVLLHELAHAATLKQGGYAHGEAWAQTFYGYLTELLPEAAAMHREHAIEVLNEQFPTPAWLS